MHLIIQSDGVGVETFDPRSYCGNILQTIERDLHNNDNLTSSWIIRHENITTKNVQNKSYYNQVIISGERGTAGKKGYCITVP